MSRLARAVSVLFRRRGGMLLDIDVDANSLDSILSSSTITNANVDIWTIADNDGVYRAVPQNAIPIGGLRRVRNVLAQSEPTGDWTAESGSLSDGVFTASAQFGAYYHNSNFSTTTGDTVIVTVDVTLVSGSTGFRVNLVNASATGNNTSRTLTVGRQRISVPMTITSGVANTKVRLQTTATSNFPSWIIHNYQFEVSTGRADTTTPSEYVSSAFTSFGATGLQYFNTTNGNSVDGNGVVTEGTGTAITGGHLDSQEARTNRCTNYNWKPDAGLTNCTASGGTFTREADSANIPAELVAIGNTYALKLVNASGSTQTVTITGQCGTTGAVSLMVYARFTGSAPSLQLTGGTGAVACNNSYAVTKSENVTSGDATKQLVISVPDGTTVWFIGNQLEAGAYCTAPIPTSGSAVSRVALTHTRANPLKDAAGSVYCELQVPVASTSLGGLYLLSLGTSPVGLFIDGTDFKLTFSDGTNATDSITLDANTTYKAVVAWTGTTLRLTVNGTTYTGTYDGAMMGATQRIGGVISASSEVAAKIYQLKEYRTALTQAQAEALTA